LDCFADTKIEQLINLAAQHEAPDVEYWIRTYLSQPEARILHTALHSNESLIQKLIESIKGQKGKLQ
jgi:predicted kinase